MLLESVYILVFFNPKKYRVQQHRNRIIPLSAEDPVFIPWTTVWQLTGLTERCVTTAFRRGGPPSKNLVDSSVQQNNRFLAVMHSAAVVLLIYQRTRNVWRRLWEVESGQMPALGQIAMAASQLPLTLTILPAFLWFSNPDQVRHELIHLHLFILTYLQTKIINLLVSWGKLNFSFSLMDSCEY